MSLQIPQEASVKQDKEEVKESVPILVPPRSKDSSKTDIPENKEETKQNSELKANIESGNIKENTIEMTKE